MDLNDDTARLEIGLGAVLAQLPDSFSTTWIREAELALGAFRDDLDSRPGDGDSKGGWSGYPGSNGWMDALGDDHVSELVAHFESLSRALEQAKRDAVAQLWNRYVEQLDGGAYASLRSKLEDLAGLEVKAYDAYMIAAGIEPPPEGGERRFWGEPDERWEAAQLYDFQRGLLAAVLAEERLLGRARRWEEKRTAAEVKVLESEVPPQRRRPAYDSAPIQALALLVRALEPRDGKPFVGLKSRASLWTHLHATGKTGEVAGGAFGKRIERGLQDALGISPVGMKAPAVCREVWKRRDEIGRLAGKQSAAQT